VANNIDLTATFDTTDAIKSVNKFGTEASKSIDGVNKSVDTLQKNVDETSKRKFNIDTSSAKDALEGLKKTIVGFGAAYLSFNAISGFVGKIVSESIEAENSLNQLNAALARNGQLTAQTSKSMEQFASAMMQASTVDDDVITGQLAIALNFTKSATQAQQLVQAAMNLSAAMKIDLGTAVEYLGKSLDGTAGRLVEMVPSLRGMSAEALKAGGAIQGVNQQFAGAAAAEINTFKGAIDQLTNAYGNYAAALGDAITQNPVLIQSIKEISRYYGLATDQVKDGTSAMIDFVNRGLLVVLQGVRDMIPSLNILSTFLRSIFFIVETLVDGFKSFGDVLRLVGNSWLWLVGTLDGKKSALDAIDDSLNSINNRAKDIEKNWKNLFKDSFDTKSLKEIDDALNRIQKSAKDGVKVDVKPNVELPKDLKTTIGADIKAGDIKAPDLEKINGGNISKEFQDYLDFMAPFSEAGDKLANFIDSDKNWNEFFGEFEETPKTLGEKLKSIAKGAINQLPTNVKASLADMASNMLIGIGEVFYYLKKNAEPLVKSSFAAISGAISAVAQGAEGAKKYVPEMLSNIMQGVGGAVGSIWGPVGSAIGTGIGGIFGEQIKLASLPREEIEKKITEFFDEIPKVLNRILDNLPMIAEKMGDNLPGMFLKIFEAIPYILEASVKVMEGIGESAALDNQAWAAILPEIFVAIWTSAALGIKYFVQGFARGAERYFSEKGAEIVRITSEKLNAIGKVWTEKLEGIRKAFKQISFENAFKGFGSLLSGILNSWVNFLTGVEKLGGFLSAGFKGLLDLVSTTFGDLGTQINDAVSNFFGQFGISIDSIAGGFEYYKKAIGEKINQLGRDINNAVTNGLKGLWDGIINFFNSISNAVYEAGKNLLEGLIPGLKDNLSQFGLSLSNGLSDFGGKVVSTLKDSVGQFFSGDRLKEMFDAIKNGLTDIFKKLDPSKLLEEISIGGGGGGQGLIPNSVPILGALATGGIVPSGYPDDSYPALLTSGEVVVPAATTPNLFSLIDRLSKGAATGAADNTATNQTNELLRQLINMMASQQQVVEVKLDRDTLARAIIALNKDNRRLA
jgi:phage-related protein